MALTDLNVWFQLDRIHCHDEDDGWGSAEPYLWTVYFKIDGETCRVNSGGQLTGNAVVYSAPGSHGDLGTTDVDAGEDIWIPDVLGSYRTTLRPIPVDITGFDPVGGTCGAVVILMEEDNVSDSAAEAGHTALRNELQNQLNQLITTLNAFHQSPDPEQIEAIKTAVKDAATNAIKNAMGFWDTIWAGLNPDDQIGNDVFMFSHSDLAKTAVTPMNKRWSGSDGDWELFASVTATQPCPTGLFSRLQGDGSSTEKAMRAFSDKELAQHKEIMPWWSVVTEATPQLAYLMEKDVAARQAASKVVAAAPSLLGKMNEKIPKDVLAHARDLFTRLSKVRDRRTRIGASRIVSMLAHLDGKSTQEALEVLGRIRPARHPRGADGKRVPNRKGHGRRPPT